jgi:hypothetical protein
MNLDNTVIKAKNFKHAKKIVKWFESQGANMEFFHRNSVFPNENAGDPFMYYGIIDGAFEFWSQSHIDMVKSTIIELPKETINEPILNVLL